MLQSPTQQITKDLSKSMALLHVQLSKHNRATGQNAPPAWAMLIPNAVRMRPTWLDQSASLLGGVGGVVL
jgi:hypothetical protein